MRMNNPKFYPGIYYSSTSGTQFEPYFKRHIEGFVEVIPLCYVLITGFIYNTVKHKTVFFVVF